MTERQMLISQYIQQLITEGVVRKDTPLPAKARIILGCVGRDLAVVLGVAGGVLAQGFFSALAQRIAK